MKVYDTIIIGGGQAGLSVAYFLRRHKVDFLILDNQKSSGGSWLHTWDSLRLFSPVQYSSLSGWPMPQSEDEYPLKDELIQYLEAYEKRYDFPIHRPVTVKSVIKEGDLFKIETENTIYHSKTVVSATGTHGNPYVPVYPGQDLFKGQQLHSSQYVNPDEFSGKKVLVVGGGNSGAQILAEVSKVAETVWVTLETPYFLPEEIDGRYLFVEATNKFLGKKSTATPKKENGKISLSNIVQVASVKEALQRDVYQSKKPFSSFYEHGVTWPDGSKEEFDAVIWCTGFKANLKHLDPLQLPQNGRIAAKNTRSVQEPNLWLVGYGSWTGYASATIYGVGKTARQTGLEIAQTLQIV
ncbi:ArsO family NAD(P)H-dependent flavin-containing monooxygenase [Flagellimonas sp.]|uniref:ArsO family NAD(P)H-dependent flavin-containing monooxygenase n=1 Tax=Flagellimonas sp. TaxID=2058762 RepID=UPI003B5A35D7